MARQSKQSKGKRSGKAEASRAGRRMGEESQGLGEAEHIGHVIIVWGGAVYLIPADRVGPAVQGVDAQDIEARILNSQTNSQDRITVGLRVPPGTLITISANN